MSTEFAHLHVASGFSMRYGTATPEALVERAAQHRQPILALTDRDGLYGAVRFVQAATAAGHRPRPRRRPRGGAGRGTPGGGRSGTPAPGIRPGRPPASGRAAHPGPRWRRASTPGTPGSPSSRGGAAAGVPAGVGWAALCRLVTQTHLRGERGVPVSSVAVLAGACGGPAGRPVAGRAAGRSEPPVGSAQPARGAARPRLRRGPGAAGRGAPTGRASCSPPGGAGCPPDAARHRGGLPRGPRGHARPRAATPGDCSGSPTSRASPRCSPPRCATSTRGSRRSSTCSTPPAGWSPSTPGTSTGSPTPPTSRRTDTMHAIAREVTGGDRGPRRRPGRAAPWPSGSGAPRAPVTTSASARSTCPSPSGWASSRA